MGVGGIGSVLVKSSSALRDPLLPIGAPWLPLKPTEMEAPAGMERAQSMPVRVWR